MAVIELKPIVEQEPLAAPFEIKTDEIKQVFWDAADLLEKEGWIQNQAVSQHGRCLMGALHHVVCQLPVESNPFLDPRQGIWDRVHRLIRLELGDGVRFNDHPQRRKEQVVSKLREIADKP